MSHLYNHLRYTERCLTCTITSGTQRRCLTCTITSGTQREVSPVQSPQVHREKLSHLYNHLRYTERSLTCTITSGTQREDVSPVQPPQVHREDVSPVQSPQVHREKMSHLYNHLRYTQRDVSPVQSPQVHRERCLTCTITSGTQRDVSPVQSPQVHREMSHLYNSVSEREHLDAVHFVRCVFKRPSHAVRCVHDVLRLQTRQNQRYKEN